MLARVASGELTPDEAAAWLDEVPVLNRDDIEPDVER